MEILEKRITDVTVFTDRAQVTRTTRAKLDVGEETLVFDDLPRDIEKHSIQVNGTGKAVLRDIKYRSVQYKESPDQDISKLMKKRQKLEDDLIDIDDNISHALSEKNMVEKIIENLANSIQNNNISNNNENKSKRSVEAEFDPDKWASMIEFYRNKLDILDKEIRKEERAKRDLIDEKNKTERELNDAGNTNYRTKNQVEITVEMSEAGEINLDISYIVYGPRWSPVYDIRVDSEKKTLFLEYNAMIRQCSGEDWEDIEVKLSTARPATGGVQPRLSPWRIDIYQKMVEEEMNFSDEIASRAEMSAKKRPMKSYSNKIAKDQLPEEIEVEQAEVLDGATSVVFSVKGKNKILADNLPHKISIMKTELPAEFTYSSTPKLSQYAYLKVKSKNNTDYPFLTGSSNIFMDSSFVCNSHLDFVSPEEEFWTSLGIDEAIKVEYKLIKKSHEDEGVFTKRSKIINEYLITVKNNKKTEEKIVILDQMPISENGDINVNLLNPEIKKDTRNPVINDLNYLEWKYSIKPAEKIEISLKYTIDYPKEVRITGI